MMTSLQGKYAGLSPYARLRAVETLAQQAGLKVPVLRAGLCERDIDVAIVQVRLATRLVKKLGLLAAQERLNKTMQWYRA